MSHRRKAFTLVELLVVIGIIALLISILLPSLQRARAASESTVCASNLQQMGVGIQLYIAHNKGKLPLVWQRSWAAPVVPGFPEDGRGWTVFGLLYDPKGSIKIPMSKFRCPS